MNSTQNERRYGGPWVFGGACVLALAMLAAAYSNSFQNSFHFDDSYVVVGNLYIRSVKNIPLFFRDALTSTAFPANAIYRPLVTTTLAVDYWLGDGLNVKQFHRSQFAMLILLGIMVFFLFLRIMLLAEDHWWNRYVALFAAVLFSVHTTNTETINLIHVRSELLSTMGVVGSFLAYLYLRRSRRAHLYLLPMIVGALAKVPAVMFAPLLFMYVVLFEQRLSVSDLFAFRFWRNVRAAIATTLPALVVAAVVFVAVSAMNAPTVNYGGGSRLAYVQTQSFAWLHYVRLFFLPVGLSADTDWKLIGNWYDTRVVAGLALIAFAQRVVWTSSMTQSFRPVAFGIAWFGIALLPASSVVPLAEVSNEHRAFFPYIGLSLAVVWGIALCVKRWAETTPRLRPLLPPAVIVVALLVVGAHAIGTYERNKVWRSEETLWRDVVDKSPANGRGLMNYGLTQMAQGKYAEAKRLFERALVYNPNYPPLEINLGIVSDALGQPGVAEPHFARALELEPNYPAAHVCYARWLVHEGRSREAIQHLQRAIILSPADIDARYQLLDAYAAEGRTTELKALSEDTLRLVPADRKAKQYLNDHGEVVVPPRGVVPLGAETPDGLLNASVRLYKAGDFQRSIDAARKALALKPDFAEAYNNIGAAYASLGKWNEAIEAARDALRLKPDFQLARNNLAWAESERQKMKRAPR